MMSTRDERPRTDHELVQIVDAALVQNAKRSGKWLACRPGCTQCCVGVFEISQLDAVRLREGLTELERTDATRAAALRNRVESSRRRLTQNFPGDARTGVLNDDEASFATFGNDETCPVLDPKTGTCDLYAQRPMTCRVFGPPVRVDGGLGTCELCFQGADQQEIECCELVSDPHDLESAVTNEYESKSGRRGKTVVAWGIMD